MKDNDTSKVLAKVLADTYALYLKTQNYHWHVMGANFHSLHTLFNEQYTEAAAAIDEIAERIRALGGKAPAGFKAFQALTKIQDGDSSLDSNGMVRDLLEGQRQVLTTIREALAVAQQSGDEATADLLITRTEVHDKNAWMLSATLGVEVNSAAKGKAAA